MLASERQILEAYCKAQGRPLDAVMRWYRKLPSDAARSYALKNLEAVAAGASSGIVGGTADMSRRIVLP